MIGFFRRRAGPEISHSVGFCFFMPYLLVMMTEELMYADFWTVLRHYAGAVDSVPVLIYVFLMGLLFGSFLNVCIYRLPLGRSIVSPGSACMSCGEPVLWWQNIPVLSYFLVKGRCASCYTPFSIRYAVVELLTGVLTVLLFRHFSGFTWTFFYYYIFLCVLIVVFFIDYDHWLILDSVTVPAIIFGLAGHAFVYLKPSILHELLYRYPFPLLLVRFLDSLCALILGWFLFSMIAFLGSVLMKQEAMGSGDTRFAMVLGAFLGVEKFLMAFMLSFVIGTLAALPMLLFFRRKGREPIPFGTCMAVGAFISLVYGDRLILWFQSMQTLLTERLLF